MKKSDCTKLAEFCHNTRNRVTLKMCDYTGKECEALREYHQVLLVTDAYVIMLLVVIANVKI